MDDSLKEKEHREYIEKVGKTEARKIRARHRKDRGIWFGLGMMGIIGWSVVVPTLIGIAVGIWIDTRWPDRVSWTLVFFSIGLFLGCLNAWYWVEKERKRIEEEQKDE